MRILELGVVRSVVGRRRPAWLPTAKVARLGCREEEAAVEAEEARC